MIGNSSKLAVLGMLAVLAAGPAGASDRATCDDALASASGLNGMGLFAGAAACADAGREADANFLNIAGHIRGLADLTILGPDLGELEPAARLFQAITRQIGPVGPEFSFRPGSNGGLGSDEFYLDAAAVAALEARVRAFAPPYGAGYDPGWRFPPDAMTDVYDGALARQRDLRLWEMETFAILVRDQDYLAARRALRQFIGANPDLRQGTPAYDTYLVLGHRMNAAAAKLNLPPPPLPDADFFRRLNAPSHQMVAETLAAGFNGPADEQMDLLHSEAELRASWVAAVATPEQMANMLARTDFSTHVLVAFAHGRFTAASGDISLTGLRYRENAGYDFALRLGYVPGVCGEGGATSYPFAVGIIAIGPEDRLAGWGSLNFGTECKPVVSAVPTPLP